MFIGEQDENLLKLPKSGQNGQFLRTNKIVLIGEFIVFLNGELPNVMQITSFVNFRTFLKNGIYI
jgi:hypothetical protein